MTIMHEAHRCAAMPKAAAMENAKVDGKRTGWRLRYVLSSTPATVEARIAVTHCPWCGKELDDGGR